MIAQSLRDHRWENRLVILHTSSESHPIYQSQLTEFVDLAEAFKARKIVAYIVVGDQYKMIGDLTEPINDAWHPADGMFDRVVQSIQGFEVMLIGLDGGIKLRQSEMLTQDRLFGTIDAMPMRRAELRKKGKLEK